MREERFLDFKEDDGSIKSVILLREDKESAKLLFWSGEVRDIPCENVKDFDITDMNMVSDFRYIVLNNMVKNYESVLETSTAFVERILKTWHRAFTKDTYVKESNEFDDRLSMGIEAGINLGDCWFHIVSSNVQGNTPDGGYGSVDSVDILFRGYVETDEHVDRLLTKAKLLGMSEYRLNTDKEFQRAVIQNVNNGRQLRTKGIGEAMFEEVAKYDKSKGKLFYEMGARRVYVQSEEGFQEIMEDLKEGLQFVGGAE